MDNDQNKIESQLLTLTHDFLHELQAERALRAITLDASLEHDLGIDSLGRVELFHRVEKMFSIHLPENAMAEVDSLHDLIKLIKQATGSSAKIKEGTFTPFILNLAIDVSSAKTLNEVLDTYITNDPNRPHLYLQDEYGEEYLIRYDRLREEAENVARGLIKRGIQPGETVAIMLPTCAEFFYAFMGILLVGAIAVPIYPPVRPDLIEEYMRRQAKVLNNAEARVLITFTKAEILNSIFQTFIPSLKEVTTLKRLQTSTSPLPTILVEPHDIAFIQYTSGSTGDPKGVVLTHENILANIRAIGNAVKVKPTDVNISWLPLYHDMGLMSWLASFYYGIPVTILSPLTFLSRPERWLWAIHYHRGSFSGGPNFAYELCVKNIKSEDIEGLDLSSWRFAYDGSEAVNIKTLESFSKRFASYGFQLESFAPAYGLAEATVALTLPTKRRMPRIDRVKRDSFEKEHKAIPSTLTSEKDILEFVACGEVLVNHKIRIVDDDGAQLVDRGVGNIQFKGPSAMQGYFNNSTQTKKAYHDGWWDTGDLGYLADNDLFITGRKKDIIIKAGRHLFPEEIEDVVNQIPNINKGGVAAFGISDPDTGTEKLIVVAETEIKSKTDQQSIRTEMINRLSIILGMSPDVVLLVPPETVPKTFSGKLQRSACKQAYLEGKLVKRQLPIKLQLIRLTLISTGKKIFRWLASLGKILYAIYIGIILLITLPFVWLCVVSLPGKPAAKITRSWARNMFRLAFCPIHIEDKINLLKNTPMIFVSNHASYIDSLLLIGILPSDIIFTPKKELLSTPIIRSFIKKLNYVSIDRMDFIKSLEDKNRIEAAIQQGRSLVIFPESTFSYATGLRPFKLGAFTIAAETQTPICPIAIQGTRSILRGDNLLPKPGLIKITVGKSVIPKGKDWNEATRLHALVRSEIAKYCGEPVIDIIVAEPAKD